MGRRIFTVELPPEERLAVNRAAPVVSFCVSAAISAAISPASLIVTALDEAARDGQSAIAHSH
jgi:hypothetical protein